MIRPVAFFVCAFFAYFAGVVCGQTTASGTTTMVPLTVGPGFPLPVVLTEKLRFKLSEPVTARVVEPIYAFDREVIPPGAEVAGKVIGFKSAPRWRRVLAILNGDFTPLREPQIQFDMLVMKDGTRLPIQTSVLPGSDKMIRFGADEKQPKKGRMASAAAIARPIPREAPVTSTS